MEFNCSQYSKVVTRDLSLKPTSVSCWQFMYQPCFPNGIWVFQFVLFFLIPKQRHSLLTIIYAIKKVHPFLNIPIMAQISLFFHSWRSSNFFCWVTHDPVWFHPFVEWSAHPSFHKTFLILALKVVPPRKLLSPGPVRTVGQLTSLMTIPT